MRSALILPFALSTLAISLSGCVVRSAANIATAPVRAGAQVADWSTTSQDEADRNRGREMRKEEERRQKEERRRCRDAGYRDC